MNLYSKNRIRHVAGPRRLKLRSRASSKGARDSLWRTPVCFDQLLVNAVLDWLEDMRNLPPELSLAQLDAILEAQKSFSPAGDDCFLTEMKRVRTTLRRCIAQRKPIARLMRIRTRRAGIRAGLPADWLSELGNKYGSGFRSTKTSRKGPQCHHDRERAKSGGSSLVSAQKGKRKRRKVDTGTAGK